MDDIRQYLESVVRDFDSLNKPIRSHSAFERIFIARRLAFVTLSRDMTTRLLDPRLMETCSLPVLDVIYGKVFALQRACDAYSSEKRYFRKEWFLDGIERYLYLVCACIRDELDLDYDLEPEKIEVRYPELSEEKMLEAVKSLKAVDKLDDFESGYSIFIGYIRTSSLYYLKKFKKVGKWLRTRLER